MLWLDTLTTSTNKETRWLCVVPKLLQGLNLKCQTQLPLQKLPTDSLYWVKGKGSLVWLTHPPQRRKRKDAVSGGLPESPRHKIILLLFVAVSPNIHMYEISWLFFLLCFCMIDDADACVGPLVMPSLCRKLPNPMSPILYILCRWRLGVLIWNKNGVSSWGLRFKV